MTELVLVKRREEKGKKKIAKYCMNERELKNLKIIGVASPQIKDKENIIKGKKKDEIQNKKYNERIKKKMGTSFSSTKKQTKKVKKN